MMGERLVFFCFFESSSGVIFQKAGKIGIVGDINALFQGLLIGFGQMGNIKFGDFIWDFFPCPPDGQFPFLHPKPISLKRLCLGKRREGF